MVRRLPHMAPMLLIVLLIAVAPPPAAADPPARNTGSVTYVAGTSVYIDAGSSEGLAEGDLVELMSGDHVVLVLKVRDVAGHKSACVPQDQELALAGLVSEGDTVRYTVQAPAPAPTSAPDARADSPAFDRIFGGLRGRVGLAYLLVNDSESDSGGFDRPAVTLRLDGDRLGDSDFSIHVDTRLRRTTSNVNDEAVNRTRVYRLSTEWQRKGSPYRVSLGRQYSPGLSGLTLFDGLLAERRTDKWAFGLFGGVQPDFEDYGFSSDTTQYGAFAQRTSLPGAEKNWEITAGLAGSDGPDEDFREYLFLQASYFTRRLSLSFNQEVDFNHGWKSDAGESTVQPTSTFAIVRYRVSDNLSLNAGYDDRRNVILYREFENPETEFDDANRRGLWGGADLRFLERFRAGVSYRGNSGGDNGNSDSYTLTLGARDLFPFHLDVGTRSTRFENEMLEGWLHSLTCYLPVGRRTQFSVYGGVRQDEHPSGLSEDLVWYGAETNLRFGRSWFFLLSLERNSGDAEEFDQLYTTLSYRF